MSDAPRPTRIGRLWVYLLEQFPPPVMIPAGVASFLAMWGGLQAIGQGSAAAGAPAALQVGWRAALGSVTVIGVMLLLRVFDELKDVEADIALGKAGDPRYVDRAIVTGQVKVEDVRWLRWVVTGVLVAANAPLGPPVWGAFAVLFLLAWLSFKWFFWPAIQSNLLLAFATHNPLSLVVEGYVVVLYASVLGLSGVAPGPVVALLVGLWFPVSAWETSRKIRLPADETSYQTYSMLLGWRVATCLPLGFVAVSAACLAWVSHRVGLPAAFLGVLLGTAAIVVGRALQLLIAPTAARANLRPFVEAYTVVAQVGLVVALGVRFGWAWSGWPLG